MSEQQGVNGSTAAAGPALPPLFVRVGNGMVNVARVLAISDASADGTVCVVMFDSNYERVYHDAEARDLLAAAGRLADAGAAEKGVRR